MAEKNKVSETDFQKIELWALLVKSPLTCYNWFIPTGK